MTEKRTPPLLVVSVSGGQLSVSSIERLRQFVKGVAAGRLEASALVLESDDPDARIKITPIYNRAWSRLWRLQYSPVKGQWREVVVAAASRSEAWRFMLANVLDDGVLLRVTEEHVEELVDCDKGGALVYIDTRPDEEER